MATLTEIYNLRFENTDVRNRVISASAKAAYDILNESALTPDHTNRVTWANKVLANSNDMVDRMLWSVIQNATIQTDFIGGNPPPTADGDVQFVVNSLVSIPAFVASLIA